VATAYLIVSFAAGWFVDPAARPVLLGHLGHPWRKTCAFSWNVAAAGQARDSLTTSR